MREEGLVNLTHKIHQNQGKQRKIASNQFEKFEKIKEQL